MQQLVFHQWVLKGYSSSVDWQTRYYFKDLDRECLAEIALYFNKSLKEISDHIQLWNYDFLTATYYLLLFMKMQGKQPKIKPNMKKYSHFINYANCTQSSIISNSIISTSMPPLPSNSQVNANRILVEKQLASLSTNGTTPKVIQSPIIKDANSSKIKISTKAPQQNSKYNNENFSNAHENSLPSTNYQPATPHTKVTNYASSSSAQKAKTLIFDNNNDKLANKREARPKTKTTPSQSASKAGNSKIPISDINTKPKTDVQSPQSLSSSSTSSTSSASSSSSESLSVSSAYSINFSNNNNNESNNFVIPSRTTKNKNKYTNLNHKIII